MGNANEKLDSDFEQLELSSALSPQRFNKHADSLFALSTRELQLIQVCITNIVNLPKTRAELGKRFPGEFRGLEADTDRLIELFRMLNDGAHDWMADRYPAIKSCAEDIANYGSRVEGTYRAVYSLIKQLACCIPRQDDTLREQLLNDVDRYLGTLCEQARLLSSRADQNSCDSVIWVDRLHRGANEVRELSRLVESRIAEKSAQLEEINSRIKALNQKLDQLTRDAIIHQESAKQKARLCWIPFAGVGFGVAALAETSTAKRLAQEARQVSIELGQIRSHNDSRTVYAAIALLQTILSWVDAIEKDLKNILPVQGHLHGIWEGIAADLSTIPVTLRRITRYPDPRPILMEMGLDAAILEWRALTEKAQASVRQVTIPWEQLSQPTLGDAPVGPVLKI